MSPADKVRAIVMLGGAAALIAVLRLRARGKLPRWAGGVGLGLLLLALVIGSNFAPEARVVEARAFGARPFGIPVICAVSLGEILLLGPALLVLAVSVFRLHEEASRLGAGGISGVIMASAGTLPPEIARVRRRFLASAAYLLALVAAWIAFAAWRGV